MADVSDYTFYWKNGKKTTGRGRNDKEAFLASGYPIEQSKNVAFTDNDPNNNYIWHVASRSWMYKTRTDE
jgi:hypothetical protein